MAVADKLLLSGWGEQRTSRKNNYEIEVLMEKLSIYFFLIFIFSVGSVQNCAGRSNSMWMIRYFLSASALTSSEMNGLLWIFAVRNEAGHDDTLSLSVRC